MNRWHVIASLLALIPSVLDALRDGQLDEEEAAYLAGQLVGALRRLSE